MNENNILKENVKKKYETGKDQINIVVKLLIRTIGTILLSAMLIGFLLVPFLCNILEVTLAQWIWYPTCVGFIIFGIWDCRISKKQYFDLPLMECLSRLGYLWAVLVMLSVFVLNYYSIDYIWLWVIFVAVAILMPITLFQIYAFDCKNSSRTEEEKRKAGINIIKYIFLYWLYDLFYMSIFNNWVILTYIFGIIAVVVIFLNLTKVFLKGVKSLQFLLPFDFLFGVGLSIYLIYIIQDDKLQNIVLSIVAAIYGGVLTLVGVAWTIKKGEEDKKENQKLALKPWIIYLRSKKNVEDKVICHKYVFSESGILEENISTVCTLKNTDNGIGIIKRIVSKEHQYFPIGDGVVDKNCVFTIQVCFNIEDKKEDLALIVEDVLQNEYIYRFTDTEFQGIINGIIEVQDEE